MQHANCLMYLTVCAFQLYFHYHEPQQNMYVLLRTAIALVHVAIAKWSLICDVINISAYSHYQSLFNNKSYVRIYLNCVITQSRNLYLKINEIKNLTRFGKLVIIMPWLFDGTFPSKHGISFFQSFLETFSQQYKLIVIKDIDPP